jgi:hypothetical protein
VTARNPQKTSYSTGFAACGLRTLRIDNWRPAAIVLGSLRPSPFAFAFAFAFVFVPSAEGPIVGVMKVVPSVLIVAIMQVVKFVLVLLFTPVFVTEAKDRCCSGP